jgi:dTMP kinase
MGRPQRGLFITLEGGEGAGKTTVAAAIAKRIAAATSRNVVLTREPGGSPRAEAIRDLILSGFAKQFGATGEALLFSAARIDHLDTLIRPALARGACVICDRFADSTRAYQGVLGNLDPRMIAALEHVVIGATRPDLTFILDLPAELGLARATARRHAGATADRFEREGVAFHQGLRQAFLDIAARNPNRCIVVDAARPIAVVETAIWAAIRQRLLPELPDAPPPLESIDRDGP